MDTCLKNQYDDYQWHSVVCDSLMPNPVEQHSGERVKEDEETAV